KNNSLVLIAMASAFAIQSCGGNTSSNDQTRDSLDNSTTVINQSHEDDDSNNFMKEAAVGGLMEVEAGKVALSQSTNAEIKALAEMIVEDHQIANTQLKELARTKNVLLPTELPSDKQEHLSRLKEMQGSDFDKHYLQMMQEEHQKDIAKFENASESLRSDDVREFAKQTLPVLKKHAEKVSSIKL
ncbi:DUF4142 domain-containing protein, partial [Pseudoxanthomonas sp. SGD-10]